MSRTKLSSAGADVYDRDGDKIGSVGQLYADPSGQPAWASVRTGLFGLRESLVPIDKAEWTGDRLRVPYEKKTVKDAPNVDAGPDEPLRGDDVTRLYEHYDITWGTGGSQSRTGQQSYEGPQSNAGQQNYESGGTDRNAMTRSEEQLRVGTEREQVGQARLRKYVVTENVQTTVPVQREEVRVEREPITGANRDRAFSGPDIASPSTR
jgi:stress response protein YsnF